MDEYSPISVPTVQVEEVNTAITSGKQYILLDVRTPTEYLRGHLNGSINVPVNEVSQKIASVIPDKSSLIYVYCLSGSRSVLAVSEMVRLGFTNVFNMSQGLLAWRVKVQPV